MESGGATARVCARTSDLFVLEEFALTVVSARDEPMRGNNLYIRSRNISRGISIGDSVYPCPIYYAYTIPAVLHLSID